MARGLYVAFYRTGEVYAGKFYRYSYIGRKYFGSSGIAKQLGLELAHIVKFKLPDDCTIDECDALEKKLIDYVAERYGLHNLVYYRGEPEFYSRFPHNGRCINCHDKSSINVRAMKKVQLELQSMELFGLPYDEVTPEMRRERHRENNRKWHEENKDYAKNYRLEHLEEEKERQAIYYHNNLEAVRKRGRDYYYKNKEALNKQATVSARKRRENAQAVFGFNEYLDVDDKKRKVTIEEIEKKQLRYEPKNPEWKKYFFGLYEPPVVKEKVVRNYRALSVEIFGFSAYTDVDGKRHEVSSAERKTGRLTFEPLREEIKHFFCA